MTNYRRNLLGGGSFFFTVYLAERHLHLLTEHVDKLRTAFRETRRHHPFTIDALVVLPDHLHAANGFQQAAPPKANAASGNVAIGSIPSATITISPVMPIIFISTRSSI